MYSVHMPQGCIDQSDIMMKHHFHHVRKWGHADVIGMKHSNSVLIDQVVLNKGTVNYSLAEYFD